MIYLLISLSSVPRHPFLNKCLHCLPRSHAKNLRIIYNSSLFIILHIQFISKFYWLFLFSTSCVIFWISFSSILAWYTISLLECKKITNSLLLPSYSTTIILRLKIFSVVLGAWQNWEEHTEIPTYLLLPHMPSHSHSQHSPPECYTVTSDEPTLTGHHYPRAIVYIRVHFCCCRFNEFGQMFNDMYPPLVSYRVCLLPPDPLCSTYSSFPPLLTPGNHWSFCFSIV